METAPLMSFKSHVAGKNAEVDIYVDRIEWSKAGDVSLTRVATGALTLGLSLLKTGVRMDGASELMPIKSMSSVVMAKDGLRFHKVVVICSGNTVEFRVEKADGEAAKSLLTQLILGSHPAQQAPTPPPAPAASAPSSAIEQLKELAQLRDAGVLTDAEFAAQKAKLLG